MKKLKISILLTIITMVIISCVAHKKTTKEGHYKLKLQPNNAVGKDAVIWSSRPNKNNASSIDFQAMAWTWYGKNLSNGTRRSLIQFDLSTIPTYAIIDRAKLALYHNSETPEPTGGHSIMGDSNSSFLQRVIEPWEENLVTWFNQPSTTTENQVTLAESKGIKEDYLDIDVTAIIQDMVSNPSSSYGLMLKLKSEQYYRAMIFASSDHPNKNYHPKLEINYTMNKHNK